MKMAKDKTLTKQAKFQHDLLANIRFLENLHAEILICKDISELKDPNILAKLSQCIVFFKTNFNETTNS